MGKFLTGIGSILLITGTSGVISSVVTPGLQSFNAPSIPMVVISAVGLVLFVIGMIEF